MAKKTTRKTAKRTTGRKTTSKKKVTKKKTTKKTTARKPKIESVDKPRTKSQIIGTISEQTELSRKEVQAVFDAMTELMAKDLGRSGPGIFNVPGLMKVQKVRKPARKARKGINPFTGEETMFKAKPASNVVKVRPLKGLKELV
ncbi:MAG: HU family DNA-binding protein [Phycisphaerales bacterium]